MNVDTADIIICPHCNHKQGGDVDDYVEVGTYAGDLQLNCDSEKCGKSFKVDFYSIFYFTATKA